MVTKLEYVSLIKEDVELSKIFHHFRKKAQALTNTFDDTFTLNVERSLSDVKHFRKHVGKSALYLLNLPQPLLELQQIKKEETRLESVSWMDEFLSTTVHGSLSNTPELGLESVNNGLKKELVSWSKGYKLAI